MGYKKNSYEDAEDMEEKGEKAYGKKMKYFGVLKTEMLKSLIIGGVKSVKMRDLLLKGGLLKGLNMKLFMVAKSRLSSTSRFKLWAFFFTYVFMMWIFAVQFMNRIFSYLPPPSTYLL